MIRALSLARAVGALILNGRGASQPVRAVGDNGIFSTTNLIVELFAARVRDRVLLFDTGLDPRGRPIDRLLQHMALKRRDVSDVFLTHAHPDHVAGVPLFGHARVHIGAADAPRLRQETRPWKPAERCFRRLFPTPPGEPNALLEGDVAVPLETGELVHVLALPGDTPGACAFHFRDALFVGDALDLRGGRLQPTASYGADDAGQNRRSIAGLPARLEELGLEVAHVCTCHGGVTPAGQASELLAEVAARMKA